MNIALERLIEGMIATLRNDVIPNVSDAYARGQAVGVIDLLNNIAARIEWAQGPIADAVAEKRRLLCAVGALAPGAVAADGADAAAVPATAKELLAERDRLDGRIGDAIAALSARAGSGKASADALALLRRHLHEELKQEMTTIRKPLFAEIASGGDGKAAG